MFKTESKQNTQLPRKLFRRSRVTLFGIVVIALLAILWLISTALITVMTILAELRSVSSDTIILVQTVAEFIHIDVAGAIGTIATAVIARYGIREFSANWKGKEYNSETDIEENLSQNEIN